MRELLPTRGCGLKSLDVPDRGPEGRVAPHTGMWIEINMDGSGRQSKKSVVAPHTGMWIEMSDR